jgi:hypothetical protein
LWLFRFRLLFRIASQAPIKGCLRHRVSYNIIILSLDPAIGRAFGADEAAAQPRVSLMLAADERFPRAAIDPDPVAATSGILRATTVVFEMTGSMP